MSIKKLSTISIIATTSILGGCDLSESKRNKELEKTAKQNQQPSETTRQQNDSNANKPVVKTELTSDNNPIIISSIHQSSENSGNQNESIISENSNNLADLLEKSNEAARQWDEVRYMLFKLQSEIDDGKATNENIEKIENLKTEYAELNQKKIKAYQDFCDLKNNPNSNIDNRFDLIISSPQDIEEAANFFRRDDNLNENQTVLEKMNKKEDSQWRNTYDNFLKEHEEKKEKYKNITPDEKEYILKKNDEIRESF